MCSSCGDFNNGFNQRWFNQCSQCCEDWCGRHSRVAVLYAHTEKTGGTSIECATKSLSDRGIWLNLGHTDQRAVSACHIRGCSGAKVVVSVRDPFSFYVSRFKYARTMREQGNNGDDLWNFLAGRPQLAASLDNFEDFLTALTTEPSLDMFTQRYILRRSLGQPYQYDEVLHTENLSDEYNELIARLGLDGEQLQHRNPSSSLSHLLPDGVASEAHLWTCAMIDVVNERDAEIFDHFGYTRAPSCPPSPPFLPPIAPPNPLPPPPRRVPAKPPPSPKLPPPPAWPVSTSPSPASPASQGSLPALAVDDAAPAAIMVQPVAEPIGRSGAAASIAVGLAACLLVGLGLITAGLLLLRRSRGWVRSRGPPERATGDDDDDDRAGGVDATRDGGCGKVLHEAEDVHELAPTSIPRNRLPMQLRWDHDDTEDDSVGLATIATRTRDEVAMWVAPASSERLGGRAKATSAGRTKPGMASFDLD